MLAHMHTNLPTVAFSGSTFSQFHRGGCWQPATVHLHTVHLMVMQCTAEMYQFKTIIIVFLKWTLYNLMLNSVFLTAIQFSEETMEKAVTVMTQLNSLVTQCDGYVQGRFDCPDISQPELYAK